MKQIFGFFFITTILLLATSLASGQANLSVTGASIEHSSYPAAYSIDGNLNTGWAVNTNETNPNYIQYAISDLNPGLCEIRMIFEFGTYHVMENFTISWSDDNGSTWNPITSYASLTTQSGASISVDASGQITTGSAATDQYTLTTMLGNIDGLRIDVPANSSHRGFGSYLNENYVLNEFTLVSMGIPDPIFSWSFDEGTGTIAADAAGGADATLNGATWATDRFGNANKAIQTGYNQWVDPPDTVKTAIGTFAAWIYADSYGGYNQEPGPIFSAEQGSGASNFSYRLQLHETGVIAFEAIAPWGNGASRVAVSADKMPLSTWTHIAGTYDGYTSRVYINGSLAGSSATAGAYAGMNTNSSIRVGIGHLANWSVQWFQGRIDDARVYDVPLDGATLQKIAETWNGYQVDQDDWVNTGDWLGWVYIGYKPWIWIDSIQSYGYIPTGNWVYLSK